MEKVEYQKMRERVTWGVLLMKELCEENKISFNEELLKKGCEVGITLFIQSERVFSRKV